MPTLGYNKDFNPLAGKKFGLFSKSERKRANELTAAYDTQNFNESSAWV